MNAWLGGGGDDERVRYGGLGIGAVVLVVIAAAVLFFVLR